MSDAVVAIFVADPSARFFAGPEALTELYQLTHSEASSCACSPAGLSLEEAADKRGVSPEHRAQPPEARVREDRDEPPGRARAA
jgi:hypothetical protein